MKKIASLYFFLPFLTISSIFAQNWKSNYQKADSLAEKLLYKASVLQYEQTLPLAEKEFGKASDEYLLTRNSLGRYMIFAGEKEKTLQILTENIGLCIQKGEKTTLYTQALLNIGTFYLPINRGNDADKSMGYLQIALKIRQEMVGTKHLDYAYALQILATLYLTTNNYLLAERTYQEVLQIRKQTLGVKNDSYLTTLNNLGIVYKKIGNNVLAEKYYKEVVAIRQEVLGEKHLSTLTALANLAALQQTMGNYPIAELNLKTVLEARKEIVGEKNEAYLISLRDLANLYKNTNDYDRAEQTFKQLLALQKEVGGENSKNYALWIGDLGAVYWYKKDYPKAEKLYKQCLQSYEKLVGKDHPDYARAGANLAELYKNTDHYALADSLATISYPIFKKNQNSDLFWTYNIMGLIQTAQKRYAEAEQNLVAGEALIEKLQGRAGFHTMYNRQCLALFYYERQQADKAMPLFLENKNSAIYQISHLFPLFSEAEKVRIYDERFKRIFENFNAFVVSQYEKGAKQSYNDQLYDLQLLSKGVLLKASQKIKNRILDSQDSTLIRDYENWASFKLNLAKYKQMPKEDLKKDKINLDSLLDKSNDMEKALSVRSQAFVTLSDTLKITWQDIRKKLKRKEAAIEIIRINKLGINRVITDSSSVKYPRYAIYGHTDTVCYAALIIRKRSKQPELVMLADGNKMEDVFFKRYRNSVVYNVADKKSYELYWQPIKAKLKGIDKVYFSPDGIYNQINLNILQNPDSKQYIFDEVEIQQLTNTSDILALNAKQANPQSEALVNKAAEGSEEFRAVLFGRPAYDMDSVAYLASVELHKKTTKSYVLRDMRDMRNNKIADLIGTEAEVTLINNMLRNNDLRTEKYVLQQATEQKIKGLKSPTILHIATHGFFIKGLNGENPMLNSGILLSGVSNYYRNELKFDVDDGILTAHEAQDLRLENTDLVVLSACETALGEIKNGEGVYGLQRAFKVAGARSILMSHWKVDDQVTQELMVKFYENWLKVGNRRDAFRLAQVQIREKYPRPSLWGAFVLVGN